MSDSIKAVGRSGNAVVSPVCFDDLVCTRRLEKRGQLSAWINPPNSCSCFTSAEYTYLGAADVSVKTYSFHPHSNASSNHHNPVSSLKRASNRGTHYLRIALSVAPP